MPIIQDNYKQVKDLFKQTLQRIINSVISIHDQQSNILTSFNKFINEKKFTQDIPVIEEDDQKVIQERLFRKGNLFKKMNISYY